MPFNYGGKDPRLGGIFYKLVEKANKTVNSDTAKKIRKQLLIWGIAAAAAGGILMIVSLFSFVSVGFGAMDDPFRNFAGIGTKIALSFVGFFVASILLGIGTSAIKAGLAIVVAGAAAETLDINRYCPKCGDRVDGHEMFCNKCGYNLRADKKCPDCGRQNDFDDEFCTNCGKKL